MEDSALSTFLDAAPPISKASTVSFSGLSDVFIFFLFTSAWKCFCILRIYKIGEFGFSSYCLFIFIHLFIYIYLCLYMCVCMAQKKKRNCLGQQESPAIVRVCTQGQEARGVEVMLVFPL